MAGRTGIISADRSLYEEGIDEVLRVYVSRSSNHLFRFPVMERFMAHYECGIAVDPDKPTEIANAIHYLQMNPDEAIRMGANGKKAVIEKLNWHHEEKKLIHWYNDLLGRET